MISPEQIKAARAWIGWTREALADEAGVSPATIRNIEIGKISHRSAEPVRIALENQGFKFYGQYGLSFQTEENRTLEGSGSSDSFYEDVLATIQEKGGEIAAMFQTQEEFMRSFGVTDPRNMKPLENLAKLVSVKCLLSDVQYLSQPMPFVEFRATPVNMFSLVGAIAYGDKTAFVVTSGTNFTYHIKKSASCVQNTRSDFTSRWDAGLPLSLQPPLLQKRI